MALIEMISTTECSSNVNSKEKVIQCEYLLLDFCGRSLSIIPTVAAYNNRAQAAIKLNQWQNAMTDCHSVLQLEPGNVKGTILQQQYSAIKKRCY